MNKQSLATLKIRTADARGMDLPARSAPIAC